MDASKRKLPSWMLGVNNNENKIDKSSINGCQKDEGIGKLVKGKRVSGKRRKDDGDGDNFEPESGDLSIGDGGSRRIKRKVNGSSGYVEGDDESRERKKTGRGMSYQMKSNVVDGIVDDGIGYGKRRNTVKVRKEKHGSNIVDSNDYDHVDGDNGIYKERRSSCSRKRKGNEGKSGVSDTKTPEFEEDEAEDDDDCVAEVVMRKCKRKRQAGREKLIDSNDLVHVQGTSASVSYEEDLTVEDLVSIAQEYVNKDMEAGQQLSMSQGVSNVANVKRIRKENPKESEEIGENQTSERSIDDNTQSEGSFDSKLLNNEEARPRGLLNENVTVVKPIMTGDPTQDMLDLFLGHLLKRPQEEEKKLDISLAIHRQEPVAAPVAAVPFTKKKSSLKDKVAMFFD